MFLGAFNMISVPKLPVVYPMFHIANQWCSGQGEFKEQSRIVDEDNHVIVASPEITFALKDFTSGHFVISRFQNVKLDRPGKYSVEVMLNGELFRRFPFTVSELKQGAVS